MAILEGSKPCQRAGSPSVWSQGLSEGWQPFWEVPSPVRGPGRAWDKVWQPFWMVPRPMRGLEDLLEGLADLLEGSKACQRAASPSG